MAVLGAAGLLALVSGASAEAPVDTSPPNTGVSHQVFFGEEEISDVSLATSTSSTKKTPVHSSPDFSSPEVAAAAVATVVVVVVAEAAVVAVAEVAEAASALEVAVVVDAQDAAWAGGEFTA